jgi:ribosomal protein L18
VKPPNKKWHPDKAGCHLQILTSQRGRLLVAISAATTTAEAAATSAAATTAVAAATSAAATATTVAAATSAAAATTAPAATATTSATTTEAARTVFTRARFVDGQLAALPAHPIDGLDGCVHGFWSVHAHKGKTTWAPRLTIHRQMDVRYFSVLGKKLAQLNVGSLEGEIPHIHLGVHIYLELADTQNELTGLAPNTGY